MDLESKYCYFYHSWDFVPYKLCTSSGSEFLKFVGPKGAEFRQVRQNPHTWQFYCLPNIFCCFVCNGFAKHVLWLLISCLTDCLCNLGSKYNDRICPGFINSKFAKVICSRSVALSLIGGIRGIPLKNIAYNLVIADSYQI